MHLYFVYILANSRNTVLYIGITNNLVRRVHEHKLGLIPGFTEKYNVNKLVYYEYFNHSETAIAREKEMKKKTRAKKESFINKINPSWKDLYNKGKIDKLFPT